jgi:hypothetical protein
MTVGHSLCASTEGTLLLPELDLKKCVGGRVDRSELD